MAIAYESTSTSSTNTVNVPSGTADGDLLVAVLGDGSSEFTAPAGWTTVDSYEHYPSGNDWVWVGYIIVSGTPPASYTWGGGTGITKIFMQRFSGVGSYGGFAAQSNTGSTILTCPSVTPDEDNALIVFTGGGFATSMPSVPAGYTNEQYGGGSSGVPELFIASLIQGSAAATGDVDSTGWNAFSGLEQRGVHVWFREAASTSPITGTASLAFTASGDIKGSGDLSGASSLSLSTAGELQATGSLAGTSALEVATTGDLKGTSGLSGSSSLAIDTTGDLKAAGDLSGASDLVVSTAGTVKGAGALAGESALAFTTAGELVAVGGDIAGSADITISTTGELTGKGSLAGSSSIELTTAGELTGAGSLEGAAGIEFTNSGDLKGTGDLSGSADLEFTTAGDLAAASQQIGGSSGLTFSATGELKGRAKLAAAITLALSGSGEIRGSGKLDGTVALAISTTAAISGGVADPTDGITFACIDRFIDYNGDRVAELDQIDRFQEYD